ncbi:MAG TPA: cytochrome c oxidase subunit II [Streptosporangiaceae bacterium]
MAAPAAAQPPSETAKGPNHGLRLVLLWLPVAVAADLLIYLVWGPHLPPGQMSTSASSQQFDIKIMAVMAAPVMAFVLIYFGYALVVWRQKAGDTEDGPAIQGNTRIQASWITITSVLVLFLAGFGSYELVTTGPAGADGAGSGEGPSPIWTPGGKPLQVQVIGQQWRFTYRYPQYGGFETTQLVLPVGEEVEFHVTSLDVIHSFWAYQLGVKADANPGVDNVAFTKALQTGTVTVRCDELCGLWHGAMYNFGKVESVSAFRAWAQKTEVQLASVTKMLPPYATSYEPTVVPQINKAMAKSGIAGANGYYYPPNDPAQP